MSSIEDTYLDVLQNIEFAIVVTYKERREMTDYDVMRMFDALLNGYVAERTGQPPRNARLSELEQLLLERTRGMCEWRLGRGAPPGKTEGFSPRDVSPVTTDAIISCLRKLIKSVKRWNSVGGKQGYLNFIIQYVK